MADRYQLETVGRSIHITTIGDEFLDRRIVAFLAAGDRDRAEYIVAACNAHDDLVAALEILADPANYVAMAVPMFVDGDVQAFEIARAALAKARPA